MAKGFLTQPPKFRKAKLRSYHNDEEALSFAIDPSSLNPKP